MTTADQVVVNCKGEGAQLSPEIGGDEFGCNRARDCE